MWLIILHYLTGFKKYSVLDLNTVNLLWQDSLEHTLNMQLGVEHKNMTLIIYISEFILVIHFFKNNYKNM